MQNGSTTLPQDVWELFDVSWAPEEGGLISYLARTLDRCAQWFHATGASIFLATEVDGTYKLAAKAGSDNHLPDDAVIHRGQGIAGASLQSREALLLGNPKDHPLLSDKDVSRRKEIGSALVIPLSLPNAECLGVMNLSRKADQESFNETDLKHAKVLANFVAMALSNAKFFTEIHEAMEVADSARSKLQAVIGCLGVAVVVVGPDGQISNQNLEADRLLGEATDESRFTKAPLELRKTLNDALAKSLQGESSRFRLRDAAASRAWSLVVTPVNGGGATAAVEEVTEQEKALEERARMKRLAEIGQMTAAVAHEIRNPLTGIRSAAQMIKESPEDSEMFASIIEQEAIKLNSLCDEFLNFAKPLVLRLAHVDLNTLIQRVGTSHMADFDAAGVKLEIEIGMGLPTIQGDELRIEQVLRNLLLNAMQATPEGGTVRVETGEWGFTVIDNGSGMKPETVENLFTPFFTTKPKGTGLGLSNVRKIVEAHGGSIRVQSQVGLGTRFDVYLASHEEESLKQIA